MKTLFSKTIGAILIGGAFAATTAWADGSPTAQIQDQINAQIGITSDSINQVLKKMEEKSQTNDGMKHADYLIKAPIEREQAKKALEDFENYLNGTIFPEIHSIIVNYNNVYTSNAYNPQQKQMMLDNTAGVVKGFFEQETVKYQVALFKLYEALGPGYRSYVQGYSNEDALFVSTFLPVMTAGCYSLSCVSFSATDEVLFYSLVRYSFGGPIGFSGLDGRIFTLNENGDYQSDGVYGVGYLRILSSESHFPPEIKNLPFDIGPDAYGIAVTKQTSKLADTSKPAEECKPHGWSHKCKN